MVMVTSTYHLTIYIYELCARNNYINQNIDFVHNTFPISLNSRKTKKKIKTFLHINKNFELCVKNQINIDTKINNFDNVSRVICMFL